MASQYELQNNKALNSSEDLELADDTAQSSAIESSAIESDAIVSDDIESDDDSSVESDAAQPSHNDHNIAARQRVREELSQQIEAFLAHGGHINKLPTSTGHYRQAKPASDHSSSSLM